MQIGASIRGDKELMAEFAKLAKEVQQSREIAKGIHAGAMKLRNEIRKAAPKQRKKAKSEPIKTKSGLPHIFDTPEWKANQKKVGNLRKGIIVFDKRQNKNPYSFVKATAPHSWLVEHGAARGQPAIAGRARGKPTGKKSLSYMWMGRQRFYRFSTPGPMPPRPFFHPTVDKNANNMYMFMNSMIMSALQFHTQQMNYIKLR